jgi:hypothetical protein
MGGVGVDHEHPSLADHEPDVHVDPGSPCREAAVGDFDEARVRDELGHPHPPESTAPGR